MKAVLDAGPIIHLEQINKLEILEVIDERHITEEVENEVGEAIINKTRLDVETLNASGKDRAKHISSRYGIDLGESTVIALSSQINSELIFTDDLDARKTAKSLDLEPHGTLALVTKAYSENVIDKNEANQVVDSLYRDSSLFITKDLVKWTKEQINSSP
ncbi:MAG: hypothetical protein R6V35_02855 [Candidatus Nanohaloarchaea archaeon]